MKRLSVRMIDRILFLIVNLYNGLHRTSCHVPSASRPETILVLISNCAGCAPCCGSIGEPTYWSRAVDLCSAHAAGALPDGAVFGLPVPD